MIARDLNERGKKIVVLPKEFAGATAGYIIALVTTCEHHGKRTGGQGDAYWAMMLHQDRHLVDPEGLHLLRCLHHERG